MSIRGTLSGFVKTGLLAISMLAAMLGLLAGATATQAAVTHQITVDNGRLTMGYVFLNNQIMPADVPGPLDPDISNTSGSGSIDVEIDGSSATVAEEDFKMPIVWIPDPTAGGAPIPMKFGPVGDLQGTWNGATGDLSLTGTLRVDVIWGFNEEGPQICRFNSPDITWTTGPNAISPGVKFSSVGGLEGQGAISAFWTKLPSGESINGGNCSKPNAVVQAPGAVWLSSGVALPPAPPTCQDEGKEGLWPDCEEEEPWPDPDPEPVVEISRVKVGKGTVKAGKTTKIGVTVTNTGDKDAVGLAVKLKSNNRNVKVPAQVKLTVPAGKSATVRFKVKATGKAKGKATITARTSGISGKGIVTVKKKKKKK